MVAKARALYDWLYDHMQYDKSVPGWGLGDIPSCLRVGKGNCTNFHPVFIALARASGIPARASLEPDGTGRHLNYFIYPVARADRQDVPSDWTLRYADEPAAARAVAGAGSTD